MQRLALVLGCLAIAPLHAQSPQTRLAIEVTETLQASGQRYDSEGLTLWIDPNGLDEAEVLAFFRNLERGLAVLRPHLGELLDEPESPRTIEVYMSPRVRMSHVRFDHPTMVYIPTWRISDRSAPYLHEMVHAMASWSWRHSEWLGEGLANHVAAAVEPISGGYHSSVVLPERLRDVQLHLATPQGQEVLDLVGPRGRRNELPPELDLIVTKVLTDRTRYAKPFYALSWSFVDYIVAREGLANLRTVVADQSRVDALKQAWLDSLQETQLPSS
ncbi:hypothetical protein [Aquimonas voraii]|uniref:hypothetical protein n=1 Tax=Aquimonas voraii TaxID=265719 RepID=UPI001C408F19|nr:hypothetical protein [Aquimonas voraii]